MSSKESLFRFGVISDIQYADIDSAQNFSGTEERDYRGALQAAKKVFSSWIQTTQPLSFVCQLGDLIDGQNAGEYGQGLNLEAPQSHEAIKKVMDTWKQSPFPLYHTIGNHELYNFSWSELRQLLNHPLKEDEKVGGCTQKIADQYFYYHFSPYPGWKVFMLNSYENNVIKPSTDDIKSYTEELLTKKNPNFGAQAPYNFFEGLKDEDLRYVPFNGGFGRVQLTWLKQELDIVKSKGEQVFIASHLPCYAPAASLRNVAFDADELHSLLGEYASHIRVYFAGHRHGGGYAQDHFGIHHITIQAPLTHGECAALVEVYDQSIKVIGVGDHRSYHLV